MCCSRPVKMACVGCGLRLCCQKTACLVDRSLRTHSLLVPVCQGWQAIKTRSSMLWRYTNNQSAITIKSESENPQDVPTVTMGYPIMSVCLISRFTTWNTCVEVVGGPLLWWHIASCCPLSLAHRTHTHTVTLLIMQTPCATSISLPVSIPIQVKMVFKLAQTLFWLC